MYEDFEKWLDSVLDANMPIEGVAVNFNFYDEENGEWSIQFTVTGSYSEDDEEWACDEVFTSGEDIYTWNQESYSEEIHYIACNMIADYLKKGKHAEELKKYKVVTAGFIDGDLEKIYMEE